MTEEINGLIEKIQQEGIVFAQNKAKEIEAEAHKRAEEIISKANLEAEKIGFRLKEQIKKEEEAQNALLKQASRDMLINLRKEINAMLDKIILMNTSLALNASEITGIVSSIIKSNASILKDNVTVQVKKEDLEILENNFLTVLKKELKEGITLKGSDTIKAGFTISFDSGKSYFDFTDKAIVEYIGAYLKPKLDSLLNEAIKE